MKAFVRHTGVAAPLLRINVDTDAIIPSREMKTTGKRGLADGLFAGWRYSGGPGSRTLNPAFVLNDPAYAGASILLSGTNFGCGSSREHAVWALAEFGIRCVIAPSFGAIFQNNCIRNGLLPLVLDDAQVASLAAHVERDPARNMLSVDLERCVVSSTDGVERTFAVDPGARAMLLEGLDAIGLTLKHQPEIDSFISRDRATRPWLY